MDPENEDLDVLLDDLPPIPEDELDALKIEDEAPKPEPKTKPEPIAPEEGLETLKTKLAEEKASRERERLAREQAERQRDEAVQTAHTARNEVQDSHLSLVTNAIALVEQNRTTLKAQYREAAANGDYDAMADLQEAMAEKSAELQQLRQGKTALENAPKQAPPVREITDPVEQVASQLSPKSAEWVRQHPEYATDPNKLQKMIAAHNIAVADGIRVDTDAYFDAVEDTLKIRRQEPEQYEEPISHAAQPVQRRQSPPAAPVSRSASGAGAPNPNVVRLTAAEREIADLSQQTYEEYARNKRAIQRDNNKLN